MDDQRYREPTIITAGAIEEALAVPRGRGLFVGGELGVCTGKLLFESLTFVVAGSIDKAATKIAEKIYGNAVLGAGNRIVVW